MSSCLVVATRATATMAHVCSAESGRERCSVSARAVRPSRIAPRCHEGCSPTGLHTVRRGRPGGP
jgi:hypothetical protein